MLIAIIFLNGCYPFYEELKRWEFVDHMYSKDKEVSDLNHKKKLSNFFNKGLCLTVFHHKTNRILRVISEL